MLLVRARIGISNAFSLLKEGRQELSLLDADDAGWAAVQLLTDQGLLVRRDVDLAQLPGGSGRRITLEGTPPYSSLMIQPEFVQMLNRLQAGSAPYGLSVAVTDQARVTETAVIEKLPARHHPRLAHAAEQLFPWLIEVEQAVDALVHYSLDEARKLSAKPSAKVMLDALDLRRASLEQPYKRFKVFFPLPVAESFDQLLKDLLHFSVHKSLAFENAQLLSSKNHKDAQMWNGGGNALAAEIIQRIHELQSELRDFVSVVDNLGLK